MIKRLDPFIAGLILMILLAYLFPGMEEPLRLKWIIKVGVVFIFFFYGLKLNLKSLRSDLGNWKLHLGIQSTTFILYPLLVMLLYPLAHYFDMLELWTGVFFLAALPSTVSSSVVMVSLAKGNIPSAIFNASLSGLLGVLITPLLMSLVLQSASTDGLSLPDIMLDLFLQIILPVLLGILLNKHLGRFIQAYSKTLNWFDKSIIWLIIYSSFSESFSSGIFLSFGISKLLVLLACVIMLFFLMFKMSGYLAHLLRFSLQDRITFQFCGTKKSLVHGSVMAAIIFAGAEETGIYILPILLYHAFQLIIISIIAQRYAKREIIP